MKTMVAPEPYLSACLQVLRYSILYCRFRAWSNECSADHIADLMDAVHNIPDLIVKWEHCDIDLLRKYLRSYDEKWLGRGGAGLCAIFDKRRVGG